MDGSKMAWVLALGLVIGAFAACRFFLTAALLCV